MEGEFISFKQLPDLFSDAEVGVPVSHSLPTAFTLEEEREIYKGVKKTFEYMTQVSRTMKLILPITYRPYTTIEHSVDLTDLRRRHLWFYGRTGTGKTWTAEHQGIRPYFIPKNNIWNNYRGQHLLVLDQFDSELTPRELIDIMEARPQMRSPVPLPKHVFLIVISVRSLHQCYLKIAERDAQIDALLSRFTLFEFGESYPSVPVGVELVKLNALEGLAPPTASQAAVRRINPDNRKRLKLSGAHLATFKPG